jgi:hypothetical protein
MPATAQSIWQVPAYLPYVQPPLTPKAIAAAEKKLGYKLPAEYLNLLHQQNGGYIRYSLPDLVHDSIAGIGPHFPSLTEFDWDEVQEYVSFPLKGLVPFDGDGHWHLCLDYRRKPAAPTITYVDIECDRQTPIAKSFADYLAKLQLEANDEYVLTGFPTIKAAATALSTKLGLTFERPDSWAHGYTEYCSSFGKKSDPDHLWLSPNTVPRGFVRKDDDRSAELKNLMPGQAPRYPELPANAYLVSITDGGRPKLIQKAQKAGLLLRPLHEFLPAS